jgi:hypothetical protein
MTTPLWSVPNVGPILAREEREAKCRLCGASFTQLKLSTAFLASAAVQAEIPGGFVPIFCPVCEHRDLAGRRATPKVRTPYVVPANDYEADERIAMRDA